MGFPTERAMYGYGAPAPQPAAHEVRREGAAVSEILGGRKELSLGDLNPLIHAPRLTNRNCVEALRVVTQEKIRKYGGMSPFRIESTHATSLDGKNEALRFV